MKPTGKRLTKINTPRATVSKALTSFARNSRRNSLMLGTALGAFFGMGYGRGAYSQTVLSGSTTTTQSPPTGVVTTAPGFVVNTTSGDAISLPRNPVRLITEDSRIYGALRGIYARSYGDVPGGGLEITIDVDTIVKGNAGNGIEAIRQSQYGSDTGDLTITVDGEVSGTVVVDGIAADGIAADGINALVRNSSYYGTTLFNPSDLRITTTAGSDVSGEDDGIEVRHEGSGPVTLTIGGDVYGDNRGINARAQALSEANKLSIDVGVTGYVGGHYGGISASADGAGSAEITIHGRIYAYNDRSVTVTHDGSGDILVQTFEGSRVFGYYNRGIGALHDGTGAIQVTVGGSVTSYYDAISTVITDVSSTGSIDVDTGAASAISSEYGSGIVAIHSGNGPIDITVAGSVTGGAQELNDSANIHRGIFAHLNNSYAISDLSITIEGSGSVTGSDDAIFARSDAYSGGIDIKTDVGSNIYSAQDEGIQAYHNGYGALGIQANGFVSAPNGDGIRARIGTTFSTAPFSITTGPESDISGDRGIYALQGGYGAVNIEVNGDVTAVGQAIYGKVTYSNSTAPLSITTGSASNITGELGIAAIQEGYGAVSIEVNGDVTSAEAAVYGKVSHEYSGGILSITTGAGSSVASSASYGIGAIHQGTGAVQVTVNGAISANYVGVVALAPNPDNAAGLEVTLGADSSISTQGVGVFAQHMGTGSIETDVSGSVVAEQGPGILVQHSYSFFFGASKENALTPGGITIDVTGTVESRADDGIRASLGEVDGNLMIETGASSEVTGIGRAIFAEHAGQGDIKITANGAVSSTGLSEEADLSGAAIVAAHFGSGDATVSTGASSQVSGASVGIAVVHRGDGMVAVNVGEDSVVNGVTALHTGESGAARITTAAGSVVRTAAVARLYSADSIDVEIGGDLLGGVENLPVDEGGAVFDYGALWLMAPEGSSIEITVGETGRVVAGENGMAVVADAEAPGGAVIGMARMLPPPTGGSVTLRNLGTIVGGVDLSNSNLFVNNGTWDITGLTSDFNATGDSLVENAGVILAASGAANETAVIQNIDVFRNNAGGTIRLADGDAGDVFEIRGGTGTGNFMANGGTVELDVLLGGDTSATDRLVISGDVKLESAPTGLLIAPVGGGRGAQTETGIEVVSVGGSSDAGAFILANTAPLEMGAFVYELSRGNCADQQDASWYLCSKGQIGSTGAVFESLPGVLLGSFARAETMQRRLSTRVGGANATMSTRGAADMPQARTVMPWLRTWGEFANITPYRSTSGVSWDRSSWGLQAGFDVPVGDHAAGDLVAGLSLRYASISASMTNAVGSGQVDAEGFGLGASLTWSGQKGAYVDLQGAVDWVSSDARSSGAGVLLEDHDDLIYSASAEFGRRYTMENGVTVVPQIQLSWGSLRDASLVDGLGNVITFKDRESLIGRAGLTVEQSVTDGAFGYGTIYGFGNLLHDFAGDRVVSVSGADLVQSGSGSWAEIGAGFSLISSNAVNFYGQVAYRHAVAEVDGHALSLSAGVRMQW